MIKPPCKDCPKRELKCHDTCYEFRKFKEEKEKEQKERQKERDRYFSLSPEIIYKLNKESRDRRSRGK